MRGISVLQVTVDLIWHDLRFNMPLYWEHVPFSYSGVDLTALLTNQSIVMWKPIFTFTDASEVNILSEVRLNNSTFNVFLNFCSL